MAGRQSAKERYKKTARTRPKARIELDLGTDARTFGP